MNMRHWILWFGLLPLLAPGVATPDDGDNDGSGHHKSPLVDLIRKELGRFKDVNVAIAEGYVAGPCVSGRDRGAMGIHFINEQYLLNDNDLLDVALPEALIYEPTRSGRLRLVGVEYITFSGPAALEGHLLNFTGEPNRYGLPPFYEIHVWAWRENPDGTFTDWNPRVSCDALELQ